MLLMRKRRSIRKIPLHSLILGFVLLVWLNGSALTLQLHVAESGSPQTLNANVPSEGHDPLVFSARASGHLPAHQEHPITILSRLVGETGNWLLYIIKVQALQWRLLDKYGISTTARYQVRQTGKKCLGCVGFIQACFPNLRHVDFDDRRISQPSFLGKASGQRQGWLDGTQGQALMDLDIRQDMNESEEDERMRRLHYLVRAHTPMVGLRNVSLPFVYVDAFASPRDYNDYYDELRELLAFDDERCCGLLPDPQTSVFHFRGFQAEESLSKSRQFGREELSPQKVASDLFAHLGPGDKLSLLSRFDASSDLVHSHIKELQSKGVNVQFVHQSTAQDFCYLRHAQKELVGLGYSTYVRLAGFLTKFRPKVRLYCLDSPDTRRLGTIKKCEYFNFNRQKHGNLQDSYTFEIYQAEQLGTQTSALAIS